jgi:hypothetical protein
MGLIQASAVRIFAESSGIGVYGHTVTDEFVAFEGLGGH